MKYFEISEDLYKKLLRDSKILESLQEYGVDNWDGYEEALSENEDYINDFDDELDVEPVREDFEINKEWLKTVTDFYEITPYNIPESIRKN